MKSHLIKDYDKTLKWVVKASFCTRDSSFDNDDQATEHIASSPQCFTTYRSSEKIVVGNIHEKKFVVNNFHLSRLQTIINCSNFLW